MLVCILTGILKVAQNRGTFGVFQSLVIEAVF